MPSRDSELEKLGPSPGARSGNFLSWALRREEIEQEYPDDSEDNDEPPIPKEINLTNEEKGVS